MMPPTCAVCPASLHEGRELTEFALVYFQGNFTYPVGWVGHPPNAVWFCTDHAPLAEGLTGLPAGEALEEIRQRMARS